MEVGVGASAQRKSNQETKNEELWKKAQEWDIKTSIKQNEQDP